jgi:four helix bundle protein
MPKGKAPGAVRASKAPLLRPQSTSGKPYDIRRRTFQFAVRLLEVSARLPGTPEGSVVRQQLCRAGTSVGANVEEADGTVSGADRRKSLVIARKEALETRYRLRIAGLRPSTSFPTCRKSMKSSASSAG